MKNIVKALLIFIPVLLFAGCSSEKVDDMTTEAADKAVKKIRTPLDKARATKNLGDERMKAMDEAIEKQ